MESASPARVSCRLPQIVRMYKRMADAGYLVKEPGMGAADIAKAHERYFSMGASKPQLDVRLPRMALGSPVDASASHKAAVKHSMESDLIHVFQTSVPFFPAIYGHRRFWNH